MEEFLLGISSPQEGQNWLCTRAASPDQGLFLSKVSKSVEGLDPGLAPGLNPVEPQNLLLPWDTQEIHY